MTQLNSESAFRSKQLDRFFYRIIEGKVKLDGSQDGRKILEAIVNRTDRPDCIERLAASSSGQRALRTALASEKSEQFINTYVSDLVLYLADPSLKRVCDGEVLNQVIWAMVDPPRFWDYFVQTIRGKQLEARSFEAFAWLLLQLVLLPPPQSAPFREIAQELLQDITIDKLGTPTARDLFQKIRALVRHSSPGDNPDPTRGSGPGGRHDNDFVNYHDITVLPTRNEMESVERPFYLPSSAVFELAIEDRAFSHLDNQFRLLREDMLSNMREDINNLKKKNKKSSRQSAMLIKGVTLKGLDLQSMNRERPCSLVFQCSEDILNMKNASPDKRKKMLKSKPALFRHQSFGCLLKDDIPLAFVLLDRNEDKLALDPPQLCLQIIGTSTLKDVFVALRSGPVDFMFVSTAIFAYEPILERLQRKSDVELEHDILVHTKDPTCSTIQPQKIISLLRASLAQGTDLQQVLGIPKKIDLDPSQVKALIHGLTYQTSQIQGPPGTGKSLVGALLTKILLDNTDERLLVLSYTNHALDQFAEDLMDIGISPDVIVRLGSKFTSRTESLLLRNQTLDVGRKKKTRWELINSLKSDLSSLVKKVDDSLEAHQQPISKAQLLMHAELNHRHFYDALEVPEAEDGETGVGRKGGKLTKEYLLENWKDGKGPGAFEKGKKSAPSADVWSMKKEDRMKKIDQWTEEIREESMADLVNSVATFNKTQKVLQITRKDKTEQILQSKRIICCTTTAASMFSQEIQAATPGIIVVEEAGEILESHILAAMGPNTKHLIQIGDHKQLRPKVNNYRLTVEAGHGYDLNRSLFERLILHGRPHCTLLNQHRMRPEISSLIRHNYPDLEDAKGTKDRPHLSGFQSDLVFFNHNHLEERNSVLTDKLDHGATSSKQNIFEVEMVLKCVRYLGQQNYKTTDIVILTPYLGQLSLLRKFLSKDHDPILNDLDSHDLVEAGVIPAASAEVNKRPIRLSTIDNYQGEESDIVVASLTRSNDEGDIGFMAQPERLNVLISRARNALIMIGNAKTFMNAKKGREEWVQLFESLKAKGNIHDGLPLKCEKHPDTTCIVRCADDFDIHCPDGGCARPCNHSSMPCSAVTIDKCPQNHKRSWLCSQKNPPPCQECRREKEALEQRARWEKQLEDERQAKQFAYAKKLKDIQDRIEIENKLAKDRLEEMVRQQTLNRHILELEQLKKENQKPIQQQLEKPKHTPVKPDTAKSTRNPIQSPRGGSSPPVSLQSQPAGTPSTPSQATPAQSTPAQGTPTQGTPTQGTPTQGTQAKKDTENCDASDTESEAGSRVLTPAEPSSAEDDWQYQKNYENAVNKALDSLMAMIGLESVKQKFLEIKAKVDTTLRQGVDLKDERFGAALLGNPGTGKTTVARLYAQFLSSVGAIPGSHFEETTGSRLANDGIQGCKAMIDKIISKGGGVFFLDEAYQIVSGSSLGGSSVLDFLLAEIENLTGKVVFVFAGYRKQMESFFMHNPGIPSRIPIRLDFEDYRNEELLRILNYKLNKKYTGRMKVEGGDTGLYMRIVARRIGRSQGREGFGNAREVENVLSILLARMSTRLRQEKRQGKNPDHFLLKKIDLIGPEPSTEFSANEDWKKLQSMIGLKSVKQSIMVLVNRLQTNYERELKEEPPIECSLNKVFFGNPGTGKTTVAKHYGKILKALGLLSDGEVVIKNPADFVGGHLGQSEKNTKAILESTKGKVLIIDEAYMLAAGGAGTGAGAGGFQDPYKAAVVDTIVAEVQSTALEDRCVLLLGYKEQMEDMFQKVNPGLSRRFPMASGFSFDDYDDNELRQILELKLKQQAFRAGEAAKKVVIDVLRRARIRPNFGNAGEVDIILDQAKERQQKRLSESQGINKTNVFLPEDIDPNFDRSERATTDIRMLFQGVIGCDEIAEQLEGYQQVVKNMKAMDMEPRSQIPFGFLFRGPPGTGKTTTARKMGKIYYDMGFLSEATVVECSATDLIGQFIGHTGPKVQKKFTEAAGRVLFIDEAYRLAEGHFAKEAMDEIVDCMTKEKFHNNLVVILAGYDDDINRLMNQNPGLTSRFPETISFPNLLSHHCRDLLLQCLRAKKLDTSDLEASPTFDSELLSLFSTLTRTKSWANARDVQTLAKSVFSRIMKSKEPNPDRKVSEDLVIDVVEAMIRERSERGSAPPARPMFSQHPPPEPKAATQEPPRVKTSTSTSTSTAPPPQGRKVEEPKEEEQPQPPAEDDDSGRDAGVSDEVWAQLKRDKAAFEAWQKEAAASAQRVAEAEREMKAHEEALRREAAAEQRRAAEEKRRAEAEQEALRRQAEQEQQRAQDEQQRAEAALAARRRQAELERRRMAEDKLRAEAEARHRQKLLALEEARVRRELEERARRAHEERARREAAIQTKLRQIGCCPVGYAWIPQPGGYRCAGGSHFVTTAQLGM
ncbi:P-loop containing nucleoside triphosphate hydrolase protein [Durotheca rogersii]|uniref:P-loop containing nucleoside triphosphate hydrolase protein n=1 Tax=Durotheca rogersii TaxID=419775 RepID=UPI00221E5DEA|nr:P-loop containing nucleoside triphosphate hydrolase protein [Durotheca rogersii]KAI5868688.1 P-loop containing nucleoside triphosphate hydrolase protein [Durotheca rogersii]